MPGSQTKSKGKSTGFSNKAISWLGLALSKRQPSGQCPSAEEIVAWHDKALNSRTRRRIEAHVAHCDTCHASWMTLIAFDEDAPAHATRRSRPSLFGFSIRPVYAMATVALGISGVLAIAVLQYSGSANQLPGYEFTLQGGADVRGADRPDGSVSGTINYRANHAFELILTPDIPTDQDLEIRMYAQRETSIDEIALPRTVISPSGAVLIEGHVGQDVLLPSGLSRLLIVIGIKGQLPSTNTLDKKLREDKFVQNRSWSAWAVNAQYTQ